MDEFRDNARGSKRQSADAPGLSGQIYGDGNNRRNNDQEKKPSHPGVPDQREQRSNIPSFPNFPGAGPRHQTHLPNPREHNGNRPEPSPTTPRMAPDRNNRPHIEIPDFRPTARPQEQNRRPTLPASQDSRPQVNPGDSRPKQNHQNPLDQISDLFPGKTNTRNGKEIRLPQQQRTDGNFRPQVHPQPQSDLRPQAIPQQDRNNNRDLLGQIAQDLLTGPQQPGYYPGNYRPGYNPGFAPGQFNPGFQQGGSVGNRILNQVVRDLINPNGQYRPDCNPGAYDPRFNPNFDPRFNPGFNPGFNPNYNPGFRPGHCPPGNYRPQFQPGPLTVSGIIGEVVRDLTRPAYPPQFPQDYGPYGPPVNRPHPQYYPGDYGPGPYGPGGYPQDWQPNVYPPERFAPQGGMMVRNMLRQGIQDLRNNPRGLENIINNLGTLSQDLRFNVDQERRAISLGMNFARAYDLLSEKQGTPQNPEVRRLLDGLDSIQMNPDMVNLNWKTEQIIALDPTKPDGMKVLLGGDTNRTSFDVQSSDTRLVLSNIQGIEAVDQGGRRIKIYAVDMDTTDQNAPPKVTIVMDNPIAPAAGQAPVSITLPLSNPEQKQIAEVMPGAIRSINSMRNAAISGDLSQIDLQQVLGLLKPKPGPESPFSPVSPERLLPHPEPQRQTDYVPTPPKPGLIPIPQPQAYPESVPHSRTKLGTVDYMNVVPPKVPVREPVRETSPQSSLQTVPKPLPFIWKADKALIPDKVAPASPPIVPEQTLVPAADNTNLRSVEQTTVQPQDTTPARPSGRGGAYDLLGGKVVATGKIGPDRLFSLVFADADQQGPLVKGFNSKLVDANFRRNLESVGNTLNRFDVDQNLKAITVGLDFAKVYDTFEEAGKAKHETRAFLTNLQTVTVTPDQLRLRFSGPSMLAGEGEGVKKADLWMGLNNGETTFDINSTTTSFSMKNITGLQAEVAVLGKRLNVHEVRIDTSSGKPVAVAVVDNPFNVVGGGIQNNTMEFPLDLGKTPEEQAEVAVRLPQTLKSLHAMRQGALNGSMAERIGKLTREEIIAMLRFQ